MFGTARWLWLTCVLAGSGRLGFDTNGPGRADGGMFDGACAESRGTQRFVVA
ncbi:hypothetical protein BH11MYX2_BH11MYX2_07940 [soil metagenome]